MARTRKDWDVANQLIFKSRKSFYDLTGGL